MAKVLTSPNKANTSFALRMVWIRTSWLTMAAGESAPWDGRWEGMGRGAQ